LENPWQTFIVFILYFHLSQSPQSAAKERKEEKMQRAAFTKKHPLRFMATLAIFARGEVRFYS